MRCRHRLQVCDTHLRTNALVVTEEEDLVLDDGTTDRSSELVLQAHRKRIDRGDGAARTGALRERVTRQIRIRGAVVKRRAVEGIRTRLRLRRYHRRNRLAELRVEVLRRDLRFRQRIRVRVHHDNAEDGVLIVRAIQLEGNAGKRLAVNLNLLRSLRILTGRVRPAQCLRARQQQLQIREVAIRNRQVHNLLRGQRRRNIRAIRLQQRHRIRVHLDRLAGRPHCKGCGHLH